MWLSILVIGNQAHKHRVTAFQLHIWLSTCVMGKQSLSMITVTWGWLRKWRMIDPSLTQPNSLTVNPSIPKMESKCKKACYICTQSFLNNIIAVNPHTQTFRSSEIDSHWLFAQILWSVCLEIQYIRLTVTSFSHFMWKLHWWFHEH